MYGWFWRTLPGGTVAKLLQSTVAVVAVLALLVLVVFPWASQHVPFLRVTVEDSAGASIPVAPTSSGAFSAVVGHNAVDEEAVDSLVDAR